MQSTIDKLMAGEVHVWHATPGVLAQLLANPSEILAPEEIERLSAFVLDKDRDLFVLCRVLLRTVLSRYTGEYPGSWRFAVSPLGKPYIDEPVEWRSLQFNLAHTQGLCVCAVAWGRAVGIDVEDLTRQVDWEAVARRFNENEYQQLLRTPAGTRTEAFFTFWTLKEAYAKACGRGMALTLKDSCFTLSDDCAIAQTHVEGAWNFFCPLIAPGYRVALAAEASNGAVHVEVLRLPCAGD